MEGSGVKDLLKESCKLKNMFEYLGEIMQHLRVCLGTVGDAIDAQ